MSKGKTQPSEDPKHFEYDPEDVPDDEVFEMMAMNGDSPESIVDPVERAKYVKYLETYDPDAL